MNYQGIMLSIVFILLLTNCKKETYIDKESVIGTWQLMGLANVSDQQKYLNTILSINPNNTYSNCETSGSVIVSGTCYMPEDSDSLSLSLGIFEGYAVKYNILKCDDGALVLNRRYNLVGKDTTMQYFYERYYEE